MDHASFDLFCCDLSMNRPGFALLHYDGDSRSVSVVHMSNVNNHGLKGKHRKCHGQILSEIAQEMRFYMTKWPEALLVREEALAMMKHSAQTLQTLHKVIGVSDVYAWVHGQNVFEEVNPKTVKRIVAGDGNADKEVVATALEPYVGKQEYASDDESDAVAVGVAWLILNHYIDDKKENA